MAEPDHFFFMVIPLLIYGLYHKEDETCKTIFQSQIELTRKIGALYPYLLERNPYNTQKIAFME